MPEVVQRFVSEIVQNGVLLEKYTQSVQDGPLRDRIAVEGKHQLVSVDQFTRNRWKTCSAWPMMQPIARRQKISRVLEGAVLGNLFFEASTRTRVSFGSAFCRWAALCDTTGFTRPAAESIYDTSRVMSGYVDAMVIRHPDQGSVAEFARHQHSGGQRRRRSWRTPQPGAAGPVHDPDRVLAPGQAAGRRPHRHGRRPEIWPHRALADQAAGAVKGVKFSRPRGLEMPSTSSNRPAAINVIEQKSSLGEGLAAPT